MRVVHNLEWQKARNLNKAIINTFSAPGDIVLDSFLGSGTTAAVAHKMNRHVGVEMVGRLD